MPSRIAAVISLLMLMTACANHHVQPGGEATQAVTSEKSGTPPYTRVGNPYHAEVAAANTRQERDRRAIRAMRGEYRVDFTFEETVKLAVGYDRREDKVTGGYEAVLVVKDTPTEIILQHLLVTPEGRVIKHWRQDWFFEAEERFEFVADQTWALRAIDPALIPGSWTQCVYEVSDAPRYCGTGRWQHEHGVSTWTSDRSWRPLPRREYTIREDYNVIGAINRHTITPHGWTHEQDNTKIVREGAEVSEALVREFGFNDYYNIEGIDFAPVYDYWERTRTFWAHVREAWHERLWSASALELTTEVDGMPIIEGTFELADRMPGLSEDEQVDAIEALLSEWSRPAVPVLASRNRDDDLRAIGLEIVDSRENVAGTALRPAGKHPGFPCAHSRGPR